MIHTEIYNFITTKSSSNSIILLCSEEYVNNQ